MAENNRKNLTKCALLFTHTYNHSFGRAKNTISIGFMYWSTTTEVKIFNVMKQSGDLYIDVHCAEKFNYFLSDMSYKGVKRILSWYLLLFFLPTLYMINFSEYFSIDIFQNRGAWLKASRGVTPSHPYPPMTRVNSVSLPSFQPFCTKYPQESFFCQRVTTFHPFHIWYGWSYHN